MIGTILRWGTRGYGFVVSDEFAGQQAWLHARFLDDPEYLPKSGDQVEFALKHLPDGRLQAERVRLVGAPLRGRGTLAAGSTSAALLSRPADPTTNGGLNPRSLAALKAMAARLSTAEAAAEATPERLGARLAEERRTRGEEVGRLRREHDEALRELTALETRVRALGQSIAAREQGGAGREWALLVAYLTGAADRVAAGLELHQRQRDALVAARGQAVERNGDEAVREYEELRRRLKEAGEKKDTLAEKAFKGLEQERRKTALRELAEALDRTETAPAFTAPFIAFRNLPDEGGQTVLVAPLRLEALRDAGGEAKQRIVCAFWHTAERAAKELSGGRLLEHGSVAGMVAVRCGAWDAGLLELLLDETWSDRPSLEGLAIEPSLEAVDGALVDWRPEPADESVDEATTTLTEGEATGGELPGVATRLGLSLRDLVALLYDRGLPFPDDRIDPGVERTLRALLGEGEAAPMSEPPTAPGGSDEASKPEEILGAADIARRMMRKLLRDRRVGGRHTRIENAYVHHFSDGEKLIARRVAEFLEKVGILMPKLNEGSHHISINPRRLRDVGQIIDGTWEQRQDFAAL